MEKEKVAEILNNYFIEAVQNLEIEKFTNKDVQETQSENIDEVIKNIIVKYESHPSILKIKAKVKIEHKFKFDDITEEKAYAKIKSLDPKKRAWKIIFRQKYWLEQMIL